MNEQAAQQRAQTVQSMQTKKYELDERKLGVSQPKTQYVSALPILDTVDSVVNPALKQNTPVVQGLRKTVQQYAPAPTLANMGVNNNRLNQSNPVVNSFQTAMPNASLVQQATNNFQQWNTQYEQDEDRYIDDLDRVTTLIGLGAPNEDADKQLAESEEKLNQTKAQWNSMMRQTLDMLGPGAENLIRSVIKDAKDKRPTTSPEKYQRMLQARELRKLLGNDLYGELAEYVRQQENSIRMSKKVEEAAKFANENGVGASTVSIPKKLIGGVSGVFDTYAQIFDRIFSGSHAPLDWNTELQVPNREASTIRSTVAQNIAEDTGSTKVLPGLYNFGMGMADAVATMPINVITGGWGTALMASVAANDTMQNVKARGGSDDQALTLGTVTLIAEILTEKMSFDDLDALDVSDMTKFKETLWNNVKSQGKSEGMEEGIAESIEAIADAVIMGDKSELRQSMQEYEAQGYNRDQALAMAIGGAAGNIMLSSAGGAVSGGLFAAGKTTGAWALDKLRGNSQNVNADVDDNSPFQTQVQQDVQQNQAERTTVNPAEVQRTQQNAQTAENTERAKLNEAMLSALRQIEQQKQAQEARTQEGAKVQGQYDDLVEALKRGDVTGDQIAKYASEFDESRSRDFSAWLDREVEEGRLKWRGDGKLGEVLGADDHIDNRDYGSVGSRKVNAFQYNNPELHQYIAEGAEIFGGEVAASTPGERIYLGNNPNEAGSTPMWTGTKRHTTPQIEDLKDNYRMSWSDLQTAVDDLIADDGRENNANAKRVELAVDDILTNGTRLMDGTEIPPNQEYIAAKAGIAGGGDVASDVSSQDQLNGPILAAMNELSGQKTEQTADGVGAKTSDFEHKVAPSQTHGLEGLEAKIGTPKEQQPPIEHEVITNAETRNNARLRLEQDYEGEKTQLLETNRWNSEEAAMSDVILSDLKAEAEKTGDWSAYSDFRKERAARISDAARVLQLESQNAQPRSGDAILEAASKALDMARRGTDKNAVMDTVREYAKMYDKANADKSVSELRDIIQAVAVERKNASFFTKILKENEGVSNMMNWALNRVCKYAEAELQQEAAQADVVPVFEAGERVHATDSGNTGTIVKQLPNGNYLVYFLNQETGHSATKELPVSVLKHKYGASAQKVSAGAPDGGFYEFLQNLAANSIKSIATDKEKTGAGNAILTIKRMYHLSKAATTIRNLISNNVFDVVDSVSNNISVPLDMLLSKFTGTRSVAVDKSWFSSAKRTGSVDGLAISLLEVGLDASSTKTANAAKYGTSRRTFHKANGAVSSLISTMEKYQGYMLNSTDEWQKGGIEAEVQRGIDELYAQGKIADDSLREVGKGTAGYRTFQDDSKLSKMSSKFRKGLNELTDDIPGGVRAGDFTMPFIQVGSNLVSRVSEYSPVGLTTNLVRLGNILWQCHEGKTITAAQQAKVVKGIGRGINGSVLIAAATWLAAKGIIHIANASGGEDDDKVASDSSKGLKGVQVNWSALHRLLQGQDTEYQYGDKMNSLDYLQPFNGHMTIGALIAEDIKENDGVTFSSIANASIDGVFQQLYELPVFQTFRDFNQAIDYSKEKTEGGKLRDATTNVIANNVVGTIVPNALRGIAAGTDPYVRDEYSSDTTLGRAWDKTKGSIPGYRETLPIKQDVYGHDIETGYTGIGNFLNENINPGKNTRYSPTPTTEVLDGIAQATGDNSVYLSKEAPDYVTVNSTRIDLSYDQQRQFKSERGAAFESVIPTLNAAANSNGFDGQMKVKAVSIAKDYAAQVAKQSLNIGFEADDWVQELQGKSDEEIAQTIIGKALESAAKKRGGTKYAGMAEQIRDGTPEETVLMTLTDDQKENYSKYIQKAKVPAETYLDVLSFESKCVSDKDKKGNIIAGSKKKKVVAYISGLKLTKKQKRALYLCFYSEKDDTFK